MIKKLKNMLKHADDRGSSFVLVIIATTFMCILSAALLMGAFMTYKLKYYKLNSLNNFYEVETALDEIYAGVGAATNEHLYSAYTTTAELVVVYDTSTGEYKTINNNDANDLFKKLFMTGFMADINYKSVRNVTDTFKSFISNEYDATSNPGGIDLDISNLKLVYTDEDGKTSTQYFGINGSPRTEKMAGFQKDKVKTITFKNVCLKRSVQLSGSEAATTSGTYAQSITTDIVLSEPMYNVSFEESSLSGNSLYDYAVLADMGIEVGEDDDTTTTDLQVKGNIYAASDYYNKDYNGVSATKVTNKYDRTGATKWGSTSESAYSGIFVNGKTSRLTLNSDIIVCPGTLTAYNGAKVNVSGRSGTISELWTDNIVIGGKEKGSIKASANAYVFDDTELNAEEASLMFTQGNYFGYSYNAQDTRSLNYLKKNGWLATGYKLRSHFSDSAIIVNGKKATLDLEKLNTLYIAGKSYIEFSKIAASSVPDEFKVKTDEDRKDSSKIDVDENAEYAFTNLTDYSTGQSLDVKTNQLMFLTQWAVIDGSEKVDKDTGITTVELRFPKTLSANVTDATDRNTKIEEMYKALRDPESQELKVSAIKQNISGHDYYYLYIEPGEDSNGISNAEKFAETYYDLLGDELEGEYYTKTLGYNVRNYENFEVKLVLPSDDKIKSGAAVTAQNKDGSLFLKKSADATINVMNSLENATKGKVFVGLLGNKGAELNQTLVDKLKGDSLKLAGVSAASKSEEQTSAFLSYMYINMKDHLSPLNKVDSVSKIEKNAWELVGYNSSSDGYTSTYDKDKDTYSYDYSVTPLNAYIDFQYVLDNNLSIAETMGDATKNTAKSVVINSGDYVASANNDNGSFQGIIIAGGDVMFDQSVKSFRGMIITGAKLKVDHDMNISADASFITTLLDECAQSGKAEVKVITTNVLKNYSASLSEGNTEVTGASISDISYEDILEFQNWKRNVE